nr:coatomer subunit delta-like [Tanacetum cinerariifolium]
MLDGWEMNKANFVSNLIKNGLDLLRRRQEGLRIMNKDRLLYPRGTSLSGNPEIRFKTHPNINKDLFPNENILGSKDPNRPFQVTESGDGLFKWRMQSKDVSAVPLTSKFLYVPISILDDGLILLEVTSVVLIKGGPPPKY